MLKNSKFIHLTTLVSSVFASSALMAQDGINDLERIGKPVDRGIDLQPAVGFQAETTHQLWDMLLILCVVLSVFVSVLLLIVVFRDRDRGREAKRFTHNTPLEIAWTLVPVLILVGFALFSVPALFLQTKIPEGDVVITATGYQWYWGYKYENEGVEFDSYMLPREELAAYGYEEDEYLLAVDNAVVVPVGKDVIVQVTGADVIHAWKIPSFAVHVDAVPGRTLTTYFNADREGIFFGQCSELCGKDHAYMPIVVKVVSQEVYDDWVSTQVASNEATQNTQVAMN